MSDTPLVSVVVPTHDRAARLAAALASVRAQTIDDLEIVVVDDGSVDATPDVVAQVAATDRRVRPVRVETAEGAPAARNRGVAASRGTFVAFLDDDDLWETEKLERQTAFLGAHADVVAVGCQFAIVAPSGSAAIHRGPTRFGRPELLWANFLGSTSLCMVRRELLGDEPFDVALTNYEDWDLYLRLARLGPLAVVDEVLCRYHDHVDTRLTTTRDKRVAGYATLVAKHESDMTPACVAYHRAKIGLLAAGGPAAKVAVFAETAVRAPAVSVMLAADPIAARYGRGRGDPALALRRIYSRVTTSPPRASGPESPR